MAGQRQLHRTAAVVRAKGTGCGGMFAGMIPGGGCPGDDNGTATQRVLQERWNATRGTEAATQHGQAPRREENLAGERQIAIDCHPGCPPQNPQAAKDVEDRFPPQGRNTNRRGQQPDDIPDVKTGPDRSDCPRPLLDCLCAAGGQLKQSRAEACRSRCCVSLTENQHAIAVSAGLGPCWIRPFTHSGSAQAHDTFPSPSAHGPGVGLPAYRQLQLIPSKKIQLAPKPPRMHCFPGYAAPPNSPPSA